MGERTVHFVWAFAQKKSNPYAAGNELTARLSRRYRVIQHQWDSKERIEPAPEDILLGHSHPDPRTCFHQSVRNRAWSRRLLMIAYAHGDPSYCAYLDREIRHCDFYLALTGPYWFNTMSQSLFRDWIPKTRQLDSAVNRADFPQLKKSFGLPGQRKFIYIGSAGFHKNIGYLFEIATANPNLGISWIGGTCQERIPGLRSYGYVDLHSDNGRRLLAEHDFLLTVGNSDSNPTTIVEAMSWGLLPICTPQSGYYQVPGIINVPLKNVAEASRILRWANTREEENLLEMQSINFKALDDRYNYDRLAAQVIDAIESNESPRIAYHPLRRAALLYFALTSYYSGSPLVELAARPDAPLRRFPLLYRTLRFLHRRVRTVLDDHYRE